MIGPILTGMAKPVHVVHQASDENDIINITAVAVVDAQIREREISQQTLKTEKELV